MTLSGWCSALVIFNSGSGKAESLKQFRTHFEAEADSSCELEWIDLRDAAAISKDIVDKASRCELVVAAGGDGTVNAVVNFLMQIEAANRPLLAVMPLGTANDLAGTLGIPDEPTGAAHGIVHGQVKPMDVVRVEGRDSTMYFANVAAGGNSVRVSQAITEEWKQRWGSWSYLRGAVEVLADLKSYMVEPRIDDKVMEPMRIWACIVANGPTNAGRIEVAPGASVHDGVLDFIFIRAGDTNDIVRLAAEKLWGDFLKCDQVVHRQGRRLSLRSDPELHFSMDGEVDDFPPREFTLEQAAIGVVVPRESAR